MDPILDHINLCNERALAREQDSQRNAPLAQDDDPRVDVCIYFLSPHRVKPIDMKFMTELSALAPVIPVLAKADSMTTDELKQFRKGVSEALSQVTDISSLFRIISKTASFHQCLSLWRMPTFPTFHWPDCH